jgi:hypothetical protein
MSEKFNDRSYKEARAFYTNVSIVLLTVAQAYMPHGEGMKDQVDDLMEQLEELFRKDGDEDEDDDHHLLLTSYPDNSHGVPSIIEVNGRHYKM